MFCFYIKQDYLYCMKAEIKLPESVEKSIMEQIAFHKQKIADWEFTLKMLKEAPPPVVNFTRIDDTISRDKIRNFMSQINKPVRTVDVVELMYPHVAGEKKSKFIKVVSVIFNVLEGLGEVKVEKKLGVKGNFYTWIKK